MSERAVSELQAGLLLSALVSEIERAREGRGLLTPVEAARYLSMSRNSFERYVRPEVKLVRRGRLVLVPVSELRRWIERNAARPLAEDLNG